MDIDFQALTLVQAGIALAIITALDVAAAYVLAVVHGNFSLAVVAVWVQSHTLRRVFPILALFAIGHGIVIPGESPQEIFPAIPALWALGLAGLATYALETIKSIMVSFGDTTPPTDTQPIPANAGDTP